jgi:hypothetical protein
MRTVATPRDGTGDYAPAGSGLTRQSGADPRDFGDALESDRARSDGFFLVTWVLSSNDTSQKDVTGLNPSST